MNKFELHQFIKEEARGLYPQWEPTDAELRVWMSGLASLDYGRARAAIQACFSEQGVNYRRPALGRFLEHAREPVATREGFETTCDDVATNVFVECFVPPPDRPHLAGAQKAVYVAPRSRQSDTEHVQQCAESMRLKFAQLYGGHWITVVTKPRADDGLHGEPARRRAYEQILAGPDAPGRRFLQDHLLRRADPQASDMSGGVGPEREVPRGRPVLDSPAGGPARIGELIPVPADVSRDPPDWTRDPDKHKWLLANDLLPACEDL